MSGKQQHSLQTVIGLMVLTSLATSVAWNGAPMARLFTTSRPEWTGHYEFEANRDDAERAGMNLRRSVVATSLRFPPGAKLELMAELRRIEPHHQKGR
jgi:hypothetical protein